MSQFSSPSLRLALAAVACSALVSAGAPTAEASTDPDGPLAQVGAAPVPRPVPPGARRTSTPAPAAPAHRDAPGARAAARVLARMSEAQRVGQLFMVGTPASGVATAAAAQITRLHVGNVMLTGRSHAGTRAPARVAAALQARATRAATRGVPLFVATDQEGGDVQVLQGRGISRIPAPLAQGHWPLEDLERAAGRWGRQLRASGVNLDLAPVLDTVPGPAAARRNPPIGVFEREYGFDPARVRRHGLAVARGLAAHGVASAVKHFPGLGRVRTNTDVAAHVTDRVTRRNDPYLRPFRHAVDAGVPFVMMSTARYSRLDPDRPAAFSPFVIRTMLRGDLGFRGVVVSDDLGSARQVSRWSAGARAVMFLHAGGDLILTVDPATVPEMVRAVLARARHDPAFRAQVRRAALRVLRAKQEQHLLRP